MIDISNETEKKDCMFQCCTKQQVYSDTGLITRSEAEELWSKYYKEIQKDWDVFSRPQMGIWIDCESNTDYHTLAKEIDFNDCELECGRFYKVKKQIVL